MAINEWELWACAQHLIRRHGPSAIGEVERRAGELLAVGDQAGHRTFRRIAERLKELERTVAAGPLH